MRLRTLLPPGLILLAAALWLASWVFTNPPGASPDEPAHYIQAVAAGAGNIFGVRENYPPPGGSEEAQAQWLRRVDQQYGEQFPVTAAEWTSYIGRTYMIPGDLAPDARFACERFKSDSTAACANQSVPAPSSGAVSTASYVGGYSPYLSILPGVATRVAHDPVTALLLARLVSALLVLVLLGGACVLLGLEPGMVAFCGVVAAMTPMVFFLGGSVNSNGPEIAAAICFAAGVMRLSRTDDPVPWMWLVTGFAGLILLVARPLGPIWAATMLLVPLIRLGISGSIRRLRLGGRWTVIACSCLGAGAVAAIAWQLMLGGFSLGHASHLASTALGSFDDIGGQIYQQIAVFGWLDTGLPGTFYMLWIAMVTVLVGMALLLGSNRERAIVLGAIVASITIGVINDVLIEYPTGFRGQGRHWLPLAVLVPIAAGDIVACNLHRLRGRRPPLTSWLLPLAASMQLIAWYQNARRYSVGENGPLWFLPHAQWAPPGGWVFWFIVMGLGFIAMVGAAALAAKPTANIQNERQPA
jgi:Predicted membrane protein (DUF2142)